MSRLAKDCSFRKVRWVDISDKPIAVNTILDLVGIAEYDNRWTYTERFSATTTQWP